MFKGQSFIAAGAQEPISPRERTTQEDFHSWVKSPSEREKHNQDMVSAGGSRAPSALPLPWKATD